MSEKKKIELPIDRVERDVSACARGVDAFIAAGFTNFYEPALLCELLRRPMHYAELCEWYGGSARLLLALLQRLEEERLIKPLSERVGAVKRYFVTGHGTGILRELGAAFREEFTEDEDGKEGQAA